MNRNSTPNRGDLTKHIVSEIRNTGVLIYPYELPDRSPGGWDGPADNPSSKYRTYSILNPVTANNFSGSIEDPAGIWQIPYSLTNYGKTGEQTEAQSDKLRKLVSGMVRQSIQLGTETWTIMKVHCTTIGAVLPTHSGQSAFWSEYDSLVVWISKE